MPSQNGCARAGQGTGSCGVGVILAARDFLSKGVAGTVHQFGWKYTVMRPLRKELMIQIIIGAVLDRSMSISRAVIQFLNSCTM